MLSKSSGLLRKQVSGILEEETISSTQATLKLHQNEDDEFPNPGIWEGTRVLATGTCKALKQESKLFSFITNLLLYTIRAAG